MKTLTQSYEHVLDGVSGKCRLADYRTPNFLSSFVENWLLHVMFIGVEEEMETADFLSPPAKRQCTCVHNPRY